MAAVLVTVCDGIVDFCTDADPDMQVVLINFDQYRESTFPEAADIDIDAVRKLPSNLPWRVSVLKQLAGLRRESWDRLGVPPYGTEALWLDEDEEG